MSWIVGHQDENINFSHITDNHICWLLGLEMQLLFLFCRYINKVSFGYQWIIVSCLNYLHPFVRYNKWDESEAAALSLVSEACYYLDIYPKAVCDGMVHKVGSRLFHILSISNVNIVFFGHALILGWWIFRTAWQVVTSVGWCWDHHVHMEHQDKLTGVWTYLIWTMFHPTILLMFQPMLITHPRSFICPIFMSKWIIAEVHNITWYLTFQNI